MKTSLRRCAKCGRYTLDGSCPQCRAPTVCPEPVRFSPEDRYGTYRRTAIKQEYGADGKYNQV